MLELSYNSSYRRVRVTLYICVRIIVVFELLSCSSYCLVRVIVVFEVLRVRVISVFEKSSCSSYCRFELLSRLSYYVFV